MKKSILISLAVVLALFGLYAFYRKLFILIEQPQSQSVNINHQPSNTKQDIPNTTVGPDQIVTIPVNQDTGTIYELKNMKVKLSNEWQKNRQSSSNIPSDLDITGWGCLASVAENGGCSMSYGQFSQLSGGARISVGYIGDQPYDPERGTGTMTTLDRNLVLINNESDALKTYKSIMAKVYQFSYLQADTIDIGGQKVYAIYARVGGFMNMNTFMLMKPNKDRIDFLYIIGGTDDQIPGKIGIDDPEIQKIVGGVLFK